MRIAVLGAGAVGGYFGAVLARAGNPVVMIARGENLEAMRQHGLRVQSHWGRFEAPVMATDDTRAVGEVDLVLYCVKTYQNEDALPLLRPMVGYDTMVITVQNGVDSYAEVARALDRDNVLPGAVYIEAARTGPGEFKQSGGVVRFVFGEKSGTVHSAVSAGDGDVLGSRVGSAGVSGHAQGVVEQVAVHYSAGWSHVRSADGAGDGHGVGGGAGDADGGVEGGRGGCTGKRGQSGLRHRAEDLGLHGGLGQRPEGVDAD